ncbi:putative L-PSP endoribonuclease family protein [Parathielavia appendiculata]|uniref:L-PSP endoribonuclease family protein n=1 Tax=Parathielavia appendiculata TaxID=2587402 RepID=A0AAN6Z073_9PEZI|nr:putative L-PSP endoribonuclease family protein [Parathielavia appendiculata]
MASLRQYTYPGIGEWARKEMSYCQAVRVGDKIVCSGQGGWDRTTGEISTNIAAEVEQAFQNVAANLQHAGGKGWEQVYRVWTYSTDLKATHDLLVAGFRKYMPDHHAVWTELGVARLGLDAMHIEIEVEAYDPEGAAAAAAEGKRD